MAERLEEQETALAQEVAGRSDGMVMVGGHPHLADCCIGSGAALLQASACCMVSAGTRLLLSALGAPPAEAQRHATATAALLRGGGRAALDAARPPPMAGGQASKLLAQHWKEHLLLHLEAMAAMEVPPGALGDALPPGDTLTWLAGTARWMAANDGKIGEGCSVRLGQGRGRDVANCLLPNTTSMRLCGSLCPLLSAHPRLPPRRPATLPLPADSSIDFCELLATIACVLCTDARHSFEWSSRPADAAPLAASLATGLHMVSLTLPRVPPEHPFRQDASTWEAVDCLARALCLLEGLGLAPEQRQSGGGATNASMLPGAVGALLECSAGAGLAEQAVAHAALRGLHSRLQGQQAGQEQQKQPQQPQQQEHGQENQPAQAAAGPSRQGPAAAAPAASPKPAAKRPRRAARKAGR